jgi:hypothetical protein
MAAQVIAATLDYDLFRVDLAGVISKWVGETSQNFERILTRAADMHAIILFDECDAIFSKRTSEVHDAQDKFANTDAAYLLQAMESYPGIAFLATNQKGNIDPAFIRACAIYWNFPSLTPRNALRFGARSSAASAVKRSGTRSIPPCDCLPTAWRSPARKSSLRRLVRSSLQDATLRPWNFGTSFVGWSANWPRKGARWAPENAKGS